MKRTFALFLSLLLAFLTSCGEERENAYSIYAPSEEQRLVIYTSHKEEVYGPLVREFEERTGIWAEVITGGSNELLEQIAREADAPRADVMFGGGAESLRLYEDYFEPYTCAQADKLKREFRPEGDPWTPFSALPVVLIYNTRLVEPDSFRGWLDLLNPKWKGKIAFADPGVSGSSYTAAVTMMTCLGGDVWETMRQFRDNLDGGMLSDSGAVPESVDSGDFSVGVTLEETALKYIARGSNLAVVYPEEGTSCLPDGTALIRGAPHTGNAEAFLEFLQSSDVQTMVVSDFARRSVRTDVEDRADLPKIGEFKVISYDISQAAQQKGEFLHRWSGGGIPE